MLKINKYNVIIKILRFLNKHLYKYLYKCLSNPYKMKKINFNHIYIYD